jgi:hypothetical protein
LWPGARPTSDPPTARQICRSALPMPCAELLASCG